MFNIHIIFILIIIDKSIIFHDTVEHNLELKVKLLVIKKKLGTSALLYLYMLYSHIN